LYEKYSARKPLSKELTELIRRPSSALTIEEGTVIQSQAPNTYADWVLQHLMTLADNMSFVVPPLLIPAQLWQKPYVQRDLRMLKVQTKVVDQPMLVKRAIVLPHQNPFGSLTTRTVAAATSELNDLSISRKRHTFGAYWPNISKPVNC
jgi:hypothetical protein